jgi:hypothetical protein
MEYKILDSNEFYKLEQMVNSYINKGWIPQGGVTLTKDQGYSVYAQAMIKEAK